MNRSESRHDVHGHEKRRVTKACGLLREPVPGPRAAALQKSAVSATLWRCTPQSSDRPSSTGSEENKLSHEAKSSVNVQLAHDAQDDLKVQNCPKLAWQGEPESRTNGIRAEK